MTRARAEKSAGSDLDEKFFSNYVSFARSGNLDSLKTLESLADAGATTKAFPDHELESDNFANVVADFLDDKIRPLDLAEFVRAAEIVVKAGSAFKTNRTYAGNGGIEAGPLILAYLARGVTMRSKPTPQSVSKLGAAVDLLNIFAGNGYDLWPDFWAYDGFLILLAEPEKNTPDLMRHQCAAVDLALKHRLADFQVDSTVTADGIDAAVRSLSAIVKSKRVDILRILLDSLKDNPAFQRWLSSQTIRPHLDEDLLNPYLRSPEHREILKHLIGKYAFVRTWANSPIVLFLLLEKKEKDILRRLLQLSVKELKDARNDNGDSLLHHLCRVKGATAGIARLLLQAGFDQWMINRSGETPLDIARKCNNKQLIDLFSDHL